MKRKIIVIDPVKCNGCGVCAKSCPEGALKIINGKAYLVGELLCDGLGACVGGCPQGAMALEECETASYDENKVMNNIVRAGKDVLAAHLRHLKDHGQNDYLKQAHDYLKRSNIEVPTMEEKLSCACTDAIAQDFCKSAVFKKSGTHNAGFSQLQQWPLQLKLLNPLAPYFADSDLLICADCVPFAFPDLHERFMKGKTVAIFCPKLDESVEAYIEKLSNIFSHNNIRSVTILHMEVPCCFGTVKFVEEALKLSGKNIIVKDYTISTSGVIL